MNVDYSLLGINQEQMAELSRERAGFRAGLRLLGVAAALQTFAPFVAAVLVVALSSVAALAQGGPIFVPENGQFGRTVVGFVRLIYQGLFVMGFIATAWFIFNIVTEKPWSKQAVGAVCCWGAGIIAMAVYNASRGQVVEFDPSELGGS